MKIRLHSSFIYSLLQHCNCYVTPSLIDNDLDTTFMQNVGYFNNNKTIVVFVSVWPSSRMKGSLVLPHQREVRHRVYRW